MMEPIEWRLRTVGGGISTSSPVAEVKRTASESPYTIAEATSLRRGAIARELTKFQDILPPLLREYIYVLPNLAVDCASAIALIAELLL
jgi:hypothetical protein